MNHKLYVPPSAATVVSPSFHCPECKTQNPPYGFVLNKHDLGLVGVVEYFTIHCAAVRHVDRYPADAELPDPEICGCIFSVQILAYIPPTDPALQKQLTEAMIRAAGGGRKS